MLCSSPTMQTVNTAQCCNPRHKCHFHHWSRLHEKCNHNNHSLMWSVMTTDPNQLTPTTTTHHSQPTTHHSPLTVATHHSPLTTHHSPLTTHHSPPPAAADHPPPTTTAAATAIVLITFCSDFITWWTRVVPTNTERFAWSTRAKARTFSSPSSPTCRIGTSRATCSQSARSPQS
jgi:hypothetical protein